MPFTYSIDGSQHLIRQTLWDRITTADLRELANAVWSDPGYRKQLDLITDLRRAQLDISYDQMIDYTRFLSGASNVRMQAIVVSRQLEFGMARMFEQLTEYSSPRQDLHVFFDMEAAERWIAAAAEQNAAADEPAMSARQRTGVTDEPA